ncbi:MAG TPA: hypothetical protein VMB49_18475 [Acidobacteriaceae bacterium]|nr:hypothetical protein [Acidobacteriaceae bacterium]
MPIAIEQREPETAGAHPAILVLYGSMGAGSYWTGRLPPLTQFDAAVHTPRYLRKTGTLLATSKKIPDGKHFLAWLAAVRDAVSYVAGLQAASCGVMSTLLATYDNSATRFAFNDWLGTKRLEASPQGGVIASCINLPFGDELICYNGSLNGDHFTGKIHDKESGNDYFGSVARWKP